MRVISAASNKVTCRFAICAYWMVIVGMTDGHHGSVSPYSYLSSFTSIRCVSSSGFCFLCSLFALQDSDFPLEVLMVIEFSIAMNVLYASISAYGTLKLTGNCSGYHDPDYLK